MDIFAICGSYGVRTGRTANFCKPETFLQDGVDADRFIKFMKSQYKPANETPPFMTSSSKLGADARIYGKEKVTDPYLLIIHSPFELPTKASQRFYLSNVDDVSLSITPQLTRIDDTMIGMDPKE